MNATIGNEAQAGATDEAAQAVFQIEKLYVKDLSLEVPNAPQVFMQPESPQLEIQVRNEAAQVADGLYEVVVTVTVTARAGEKTSFLAEVAQAGIFTARGIAPADLEPLLAIGCPTILYPYAREAISDLITRAGFPPVLLQPVSFEQMYMQRQQGGGGRIEVAQ
jgi:preprotein translocase subunit SecB